MLLTLRGCEVIGLQSLSAFVFLEFTGINICIYVPQKPGEIVLKSFHSTEEFLATCSAASEKFFQKHEKVFY